ncbi:MAG: PDZ domain-containing protein, partial [Caulobacteraceae bacterium]|nr:PDZ domain-containing protein [Caulobacteraceae bacterium]
FAARGVLVTRVEGGYAGSIGLRPGDFIRAVNGHEVASTADLQSALSSQSRGWTLTIERAGQTITATFNG